MYTMAFTENALSGSTGPSKWKSWFAGVGIAVGLISVVKLLLHLYADRYYGYFVDELYYLACAQHLAWGYVDQPPLIAAAAWIERTFLGDSLSAIRLLPALAGAELVLLTAITAREMGGRRGAQALAALSILVAPGFLLMNHFLTMNAFEPLFWTGCALVLVRMINSGSPKLWPWFGLLAGIGLLNKHSMLLFGFGLIAGLLLSPQRRLLRSRWFWVAGLVAFLIFLPNLLWNVQNHFPFLELQKNIQRSGRNVSLSVAGFFGEEVLSMLPLNAPVWLAGLWFFFRPAGKAFRALGWAWIVTAGLILALNPRVYYLFPAFPILLAGGSVMCETWLARPWLKWVGPVYAALMLLMGAALAPLVLPLLPPETYTRYAEAAHLQQPKVETHELGPLPQLFADQFGWEEMAATVASVHKSLPGEVRARTAVFCQNYGQAGAIDLFGPRYGLPKAISGHQSYFLWGPRGYTGESMIILGDSRHKLEKMFAEVRPAARVEHKYSMPYQHFDVFYCRGPKVPLNEIWPQTKNWR
jgi:4-amino-4-deoxy-L-arabinose transferase-like glycosyltransferase